MAGRYDTDIKLDDRWQVTQGSAGDAPTCTGADCFIQDIQLEAISQPGELFYDKAWGWGMLEFLQSEDDDLLRLEMTERVKEKLGNRPEVDVMTITVDLAFQEDTILIYAKFRFLDDDADNSVTVSLSRVNVEVELID